MTNAELAIDSTRAIPSVRRRTRRAGAVVVAIVVGNAVVITWLWVHGGNSHHALDRRALHLDRPADRAPGAPTSRSSR